MSLYENCNVVLFQYICFYSAAATTEQLLLKQINSLESFKLK